MTSCGNRHPDRIESGPGFVRIIGGAATSGARSGSASARRCALAGVIALAATSANAAPLPCRDDHALYRGTTNPRYEIEFLRSQRGSHINRAGVLRYRGKTGVFEYEFAIITSMGFARPSLVIIENSSKPRNPEEDDNEEIKAAGPSAHMIEFDTDFGPPDGRPKSSYLVLPDITVHFREWFKKLAKHPDVPPPQAWKRVPCSGDGADVPRQASQAWEWRGGASRLPALRCDPAPPATPPTGPTLLSRVRRGEAPFAIIPDRRLAGVLGPRPRHGNSAREVWRLRPEEDRVANPSAGAVGPSRRLAIALARHQSLCEWLVEGASP
jgi:hypothetical protein